MDACCSVVWLVECPFRFLHKQWVFKQHRCHPRAHPADFSTYPCNRASHIAHHTSHIAHLASTYDMS